MKRERAMKEKRGFTLIEMLVSMSIMMVAIVATAMILVEGQRFTRNAEEVSNSNDNARIAGELIASALRVAGMGGALGVWINNAGTPRLISPVFGTDAIAAEGNTDDIWMILTDRRAFKDNNCVSNTGGAVSLAQGGVGVLNVNCTRSLLPVGLANPSMILVANFTNPASLLTQPRPTTPSDGTLVGTIDYAESAVTGFPPRGFQQGDSAYGASVVRFFVHRDSRGPALYRETGTLSGATPPAFVVNSVTRTLLQPNIEDLQIAYGVDPTGTNQPDQYVFSNGFPDAFASALRAVRVSVVAIHDRQLKRGDATTNTSYRPISPLENHDQTLAPNDGYRRSLYTRRVELPNLSLGAL